MTQSAQGAYKVGGRFPLGDAIERRAIGDIYQASDDQTGAAAQVVLVSPHIFPQSGMRERSLAELQRVSQSTHSNIVRLLAVGSIEDGRLFTASEPTPGATLASHVGTVGPLSLEQSVAVFGQVVAALEEGKRIGVWHRDLSPANIFLSPDLSVVKLNHFGLAEPAGGAAFGDPWFMSPEQVSGGEPDERAAIYCLGAIWYYAVCGAPVFADGDPALVLQKHQREQHQPPSMRRPDLGLPPAFDNFIGRALVKSPTGRFGSLGELLVAGRALTGGFEAVAPAPAPQAAPDLGAAATVMAPGGIVPRPMAPQPVAQPAPQPAAQPAPQPAAQPAGGGEAAPSRRKKKKGFRETLWFMKGEVETAAAAGDEVSEKDLAEIQAGDGSISDKDQSIDDRYRDDGSVTAEDRRKFSIKTGQTGMMPAVQLPQAMDPKAVPDLEKRRGVLVWVLILLVVLGGGGGAVAFFMMRPPETFVPGNVGLTLAAQVSEYKVKKPRKVLTPPALRDVPKGTDKELFEKLVESAAKPEAFLPKDTAGTVDYLAALEKRIVAIEKENVGKPRRKQTTLYKNVHPRKARALEKQYGEIKTKAVSGVKELVATALKGKKDLALMEAKAVCMQVLDNFQLGDQKAAFEASCKQVDVFFGLDEEKPAPRRAAPAERPRAREAMK